MNLFNTYFLKLRQSQASMNNLFCKRKSKLNIYSMLRTTFTYIGNKFGYSTATQCEPFTGSAFAKRRKDVDPFQLKALHTDLISHF